MSSCTLEVCTVSTDTLLTGSGFAWCKADKTSIKQVLIIDLKKEDIGNNSWTMFFIREVNKDFVHIGQQKRCHGGILHPTLNPNEMKCNYCGWTKIAAR